MCDCDAFTGQLDDVVIGVITARDTMGERPIKMVQERGCKHSDLTVADEVIRMQRFASSITCSRIA